jgi:hypothetical protein
MANTFELISSTTVGLLGAASIDFTAISSSYTDLCLKLSLRDTQLNAWGNVRITLGGVTSGVYSERTLYGTGTGSGASFSNSSQAFNATIYDPQTSATSSTFGSSEMYIPNAASSNYKSFNTDSVTENNATTAIAIMGAGLMASTNAVSSISIVPVSGTFVQYSTAYLYGVKNA